jgi:hypothetical protein
MTTERPGRLRRNWFYFLTDAGLAELTRSVRGLPGVRWVVRGTLVLTALGFFYVVRQPFSPSDWVDVTVRNVPKGLRQIYLIADGRDGPRAFNWYHSKLIVSEFPGIGGQEWYGNYPDDQRFAALQWQNARRYGALAQRSNGTWELWWLGLDDLESHTMHTPRLRVRTVMILVAVVAIEFAALRATLAAVMTFGIGLQALINTVPIGLALNIGLVRIFRTRGRARAFWVGLPQLAIALVGGLIARLINSKDRRRPDPSSPERLAPLSERNV